jgi:hypothetical protein
LRTRAKEFNSEIPAFLNKRRHDSKDPLARKKHKNINIILSMMKRMMLKRMRMTSLNYI